jgi:hypothetical protein
MFVCSAAALEDDAILGEKDLIARQLISGRLCQSLSILDLQMPRVGFSKSSVSLCEY